MTDSAPADSYGTLSESATLTIRRVLPGPPERIWAFLTESDQRRKWLASGEMELQVGAPFELVWRNDELTDPPGTRPEGHSAENRLESRILEVDPPKKLAFTWRGGDVTFDLVPEGENVLLTLTHRRISDRANRVMVGAGWHMHLDILAARLAGGTTAPFWDGWSRLREDYDRRIPV